MRLRSDGQRTTIVFSGSRCSERFSKSEPKSDTSVICWKPTGESGTSRIEAIICSRLSSRRLCLFFAVALPLVAVVLLLWPQTMSQPAPPKTKCFWLKSSHKVSHEVPVSRDAREQVLRTATRTVMPRSCTRCTAHLFHPTCWRPASRWLA